ncbi:hypothetical protein AB1Y20_015817 [Prymnesium parvum]|uniref:N-acetyltransferase domain-containing protein n=1 Tax=Prymnesium parvum TaxID=97485 RepID=A0AB34JZL5_PRYPA
MLLAAWLVAASSFALPTRLLLRWTAHDAPSGCARECALLDRLSFPPHGLWSASQHEEEQRSKRSAVLTAWEGPRVVAFAYASNVLDETHLLSIVVHPDFRRRALARTLLLASVRLAFASGHELCTLEVRTGNEAAIALYRSCGFQHVGVRRNYFSQPREDAQIMTCYRQEHAAEVEAQVERSKHKDAILTLSDISGRMEATPVDL